MACVALEKCSTATASGGDVFLYQAPGFSTFHILHLANRNIISISLTTILSRVRRYPNRESEIRFSIYTYCLYYPHHFIEATLKVSQVAERKLMVVDSRLKMSFAWNIQPRLSFRSPSVTETIL